MTYKTEMRPATVDCETAVLTCDQCGVEVTAVSEDVFRPRLGRPDGWWSVGKWVEDVPVMSGDFCSRACTDEWLKAH